MTYRPLRAPAWLIFAVALTGGACTAGPGALAPVTPAPSVAGQGECPTSQPAALPSGETRTVTIDTALGSMTLKIDADLSPIAAGNFVALAGCGYYDGVVFHRVVPGFVIQGGDPLGNGTGGPGYSVDEKPPANLAYTKGVVAMAKSSAEPPGRSGSQFYVVTGADAGLPPEYALVGKVSEGMDVVERIGKLGTPEEKPKQTVIIEHAVIEHP
jgi:peptidyl-prolyl cis-trans isomerase B (cyclophilin B)